jgi:hypothetical protein
VNVSNTTVYKDWLLEQYWENLPAMNPATTLLALWTSELTEEAAAGGTTIAPLELAEGGTVMLPDEGAFETGTDGGLADELGITTGIDATGEEEPAADEGPVEDGECPWRDDDGPEGGKLPEELLEDPSPTSVLETLACSDFPEDEGIVTEMNPLEIESPKLDTEMLALDVKMDEDENEDEDATPLLEVACRFNAAQGFGLRSTACPIVARLERKMIVFMMFLQ